MRCFTFIPALFGLPSFAALLATEFPHLLIPLVSTSPNTAYGTQYDATISLAAASGAQQWTEVSFDVPGNAAVICRLNFKINTNANKNAPRGLSGEAPFAFNISRIESKMDKDKDTWNSHPAIIDHIATYTVDYSGAVTTVDSKLFDCPKGQVAQFVMTPASQRDFKFYWFELDYPDNEGGAHGVVLEMYT